MLKEHQYKNAIVIDGEWYVPNETDDSENDCKTCALHDICKKSMETLCSTIHDLGLGYNYIKLEG